jgi:hypothetical protein
MRGGRKGKQRDDGVTLAAHMSRRSIREQPEHLPDHTAVTTGSITTRVAFQW